jgi:hypothetical protein
MKFSKTQTDNMSIRVSAKMARQIDAHAARMKLMFPQLSVSRSVAIRDLIVRALRVLADEARAQEQLEAPRATGTEG